MKLGFVTCVQLGLTCMEVIEASGFRLDKIFTLADDMAVHKSGRVYLDDFAASHRANLYKIRHINDDDALVQIRQLDWLFIIGWSQIAGLGVINGPRYGVLGMHPTLLPEGRGRAAIPWAILKGLDKTGVTLFKLDEGVDTGPVAGQVEIRLQPKTTATDLYSKVNLAHAELIREILPKIATDSVVLNSQDESKATIWPGRNPEDGKLDLRGSVVDAERLVRAVTRPYPGAFYYDAEGRKTIVWEAQISQSSDHDHVLRFQDGYLELLEIETV